MDDIGCMSQEGISFASSKCRGGDNAFWAVHEGPIHLSKRLPWEIKVWVTLKMLGKRSNQAINSVFSDRDSSIFGFPESNATTVVMTETLER